MNIVIFSIFVITFSMFPSEVCPAARFVFFDPPILCEQFYRPEFCPDDKNLSAVKTVEEIDNCAFSYLPLPVRNYFVGCSGRCVTYKRNFDAYKQVRIRQNVLRDIRNSRTDTTVLGSKIYFPLGLSPSAAHQLATPEGEIATVKALVKSGGLMILSSVATRSIEDVAKAARSVQGPDGQEPVLWMQTYLYKDRAETLSVVRRAESAGFKAIVVTSDSPVVGSSSCTSKTVLEDLSFPNLFNNTFTFDKVSPATFEDLNWLTRNTRLPVVSKGLLRGEDAVAAITAGAKAIFVSNHGGRQLDGDQAAFDALPGVMEALNRTYPNTEVYVDGGIRNGYDMYKALRRGAQAVFIGRPVVWGLAIGGEEGLSKTLDILRMEFNETMILAGQRTVDEIRPSKQQPVDTTTTLTTEVPTTTVDPTTTITTRRTMIPSVTFPPIFRTTRPTSPTVNPPLMD